jgi:Flp pilus assembly protein TadG
MMPRLRSLAGRRATAGVAALEFALVMPVLVWLFIGVADFSMAYHDELQLSSALSSGAQYAFTTAQTTTQTVSTLTSAVTTFVNDVIALNLKNASNTTVSVVFNNNLTASSSTLAAAGCYCVSGSPATYTAATCKSTCADGSTAGTWLSITGTTTYTPLFSADAIFFQANGLSQTVTVRLE